MAKEAEVLTQNPERGLFLNSNKNNNVKKGYYPTMGKIAVSQQHAEYTRRELQRVK